MVILSLTMLIATSALIIGYHLLKLAASWKAKKLLREALRVKLLADRCPCKCAFHLEAGVLRVAAAVDYRLARLAGMKYFWESARPVVDGDEALVPSRDEADALHGEWGFSCVNDGYGQTYAPGCVEIVERDDFCAWLSPEKVRDIIDDAKRKTHRGEGERRPVEKVPVHAANNTTTTFGKSRG